MIKSNKNYCRLSSEGLSKWSETNIKADPRQVFAIKYENADTAWVEAWWGETKILDLSMLSKVSWDEAKSEYI